MTPLPPHLKATYSCGCDTVIYRATRQPPTIDPLRGPSSGPCPLLTHTGRYYVTCLEWVEPHRSTPILPDAPRHVAVGFVARNHQETQRIVDLVDDQLHSLGLDLAVYKVAPL